MSVIITDLILVIILKLPQLKRYQLVSEVSFVVTRQPLMLYVKPVVNVKNQRLNNVQYVCMIINLSTFIMPYHLPYFTLSCC